MYAEPIIIIFFHFILLCFHECNNIYIHFFSDPPEITVERAIVYSGEGREAMLVCIVHGESPPEVRIQKLYSYIIRLYMCYMLKSE